MWHGNLPSVKYAPLYKQKVRKSNDDDQSSSHRLSALCLCKKEHNQTSWKEFIARNRNGVLKSEIELLYPRWPLPAAVIAGYSQFSRRATFDTTDLDKLNNFVNTYLDCKKI